jgi:RNA polymerase sigma factor (sigma-70 family)
MDWLQGDTQMAIVSIRADRPISPTSDRPVDHLRNACDQIPRQDYHSDITRDQDDNARFASVVLPHLGDAYALARWITGRRADAEDVVQDACLRACGAIGSFGRGSARAWVLTIVRHTAYSWLRKNRPAALVAVEDLEAVESAQASSGDWGGETPEAALIAKTESARLEAAIAALPAPFRETLVLRDVQGLDYREIAAVTGVPIGTVMSRLARGRGRLITMLGRADS